MSLGRKIALGLIVLGFFGLKGYVLARPVGLVAVIIGAVLLIFSTPAEAA